jgi:glycerate 2-kinase
MLINLPIPEKISHSNDLNKIIYSSLESVDPEKCLKRALKRKNNLLAVNGNEINLNNIHKIKIIGVGKAVLPMALGISDILNGDLNAGALITKHFNPEIQSKIYKEIKVLRGSHPVPTTLSVESTGILLDLLKNGSAEDLIIGLISGGGSALMTYPEKEIGLDGIQSITSLLLKCGATIQEINTIRKHLDQVKGGGLLKQIHPAESIHLILSDVLGDPLSMIASGPTSADPTTYRDCIEIIKKYGIGEQVDPKIMKYIKDGVLGLHEETLKDGNPLLKRCKNFIIGSLSIAAEEACNQASLLGYDAKILTTSLVGEARMVGKDLAKKLKDYALVRKNKHKPVCLIAGGETTVTILGKGKGGRNQELALSAAQELDTIENCALISFATDGEDGPTDAAGGIVTGSTIAIGNKMNLNAQEYLNINNSYDYLDKVGGLIRTGPTGTNVNDIVLMFAF